MRAIDRGKGASISPSQMTLRASNCPGGDHPGAQPSPLPWCPCQPPPGAPTPARTALIDPSELGLTRANWATAAAGKPLRPPQPQPSTACGGQEKSTIRAQGCGPSRTRIALAPGDTLTHRRRGAYGLLDGGAIRGDAVRLAGGPQLMRGQSMGLQPGQDAVFSKGVGHSHRGLPPWTKPLACDNENRATLPPVAASTDAGTHN